MAKIAVFKHDPYCSTDCVNATVDALYPNHSISKFAVRDISPEWLDQYDMVVFPGGTGDAAAFDRVLGDYVHMIGRFVLNGGKYLGICMGAYWAGSNYFDLLVDAEPVQYIKKKSALVKRSYGTVVPVDWQDKTIYPYFYDGCCFDSKHKNFDLVASYADGHPAAIIQGNVGVIGPHLESNRKWYNTWSYMPDYWHEGNHHKLLNQFVDRLLQ